MIDYEGIGMAMRIKRNARDASAAIVARDRIIISYQRQIEQLQTALRDERRKNVDLIAQITAGAE